MPKQRMTPAERLPRYDRSSKDIMGIKSQLSKFSNHVYDQLWLRNGSPDRIHIVEFALGCDKSYYLKDIIFGEHSDPRYDGIHLIGPAAVRHFTYRAVQTVSSVIYRQPADFRATISAGRVSDNYAQDNYHTDCEQARYQRQSVSGSRGGQKSRSYSDVVRNNHAKYAVPTKNFFTPLNY